MFLISHENMLWELLRNSSPRLGQDTSMSPHNMFSLKNKKIIYLGTLYLEICEGFDK